MDNGKTRQDYYWILAVDGASGRPIVLGPFEDQDEANRVGFEKIRDGSFEVYPLKTRNRIMARDLLKYKRFEKTAELEQTLKRAKYKV